MTSVCDPERGKKGNCAVVKATFSLFLSRGCCCCCLAPDYPRRLQHSHGVSRGDSSESSSRLPSSGAAPSVLNHGLSYLCPRLVFVSSQIVRVSYLNPPVCSWLCFQIHANVPGLVPKSVRSLFLALKLGRNETMNIWNETRNIWVETRDETSHIFGKKQRISGTKP